jgi:hypothetical protein
MPLMDTMVVDMVAECKELEEEEVEEKEVLVLAEKVEELVLDEVVVEVDSDEEEVEVDSKLLGLPLVDLTIQRYEAFFVTTLATGLTIGLLISVNSPNIHNTCHGI